jgi:uncharacterized cupin superfamily protein
MRRFNLQSGELDIDHDHPGYSWRAVRVGDKIGGERIGAALYDLPDGEKTFPYHYHHGVEEWAYVVEGAPVLRTPDGERALKQGDIVCFPAGSGGAHAFHGPGRVLIISANALPSIAVYPDSDKVGPRAGRGDPDTIDFRRQDAVEYWEGE